MDDAYEVRRLGEDDVEVVMGAAHLFDSPPREACTKDFLTRRGHHLLMAFVGGAAVGFVSGVEMVHPDKPVEMFVYELGVDATFRRRGIATALLRALESVARGRPARSVG